MLEWRARLTADETRRAMLALSRYGIGIEPPPPESENDAILDLARREHLTVYDAIYVWVAMHGAFTLASRDGDLLAAASRRGVSVEDLRAG